MDVRRPPAFRETRLPLQGNSNLRQLGSVAENANNPYASEWVRQQFRTPQKKRTTVTRRKLMPSQPSPSTPGSERVSWAEQFPWATTTPTFSSSPPLGNDYVTPLITTTPSPITLSNAPSQLQSQMPLKSPSPLTGPTPFHLLPPLNERVKCCIHRPVPPANPPGRRLPRLILYCDETFEWVSPTGAAQPKYCAGYEDAIIDCCPCSCQCPHGLPAGKVMKTVLFETGRYCQLHLEDVTLKEARVSRKHRVVLTSCRTLPCGKHRAERTYERRIVELKWIMGRNYSGRWG